MRIIFLDNSVNITASSINFKALDSLQKVLINFSIGLSMENHDVVVYNNTEKDVSQKGVKWKNIDNLKSDEADILIIVQDTNLFKYNIKAKVNFFLLHYSPSEGFDNKILLNLLKERYCLLYTNDNVINNLSYNFKYIPKLKMKIGVDKSFMESNFKAPTHANAFVTTHPLKGMDWLIELWLQYIHPKIPWAELHIYSKLLSAKSMKNVKLRNLHLILELNKNSGIFIKAPLPQEKFIVELSQYKLHLCPSLDNDIQYLSILESQACGIPVVARDTIAIHDCLYNNETGFVVRDKQTFASKIIQVLSDNKLFFTLKNNSKLNNHVISWQDVVKNFERKINENTFYR